MSTYATTEQAALELLRTVDQFDEANTSRGDFRALDAKGTNWAAVLLMAGPSEMGDNLGNGRGTHGRRQQRHRIGLAIFRKRGQAPEGDGALYVELTEVTDTVVALFDTYPRLNGAARVKRVEIDRVTEPRIRRDSPWIYQTILLDAMTETEPTLTETMR